MDSKVLESVGKIAVGDSVFLSDRKFTGETEEISATVLEIREILGKQTYVVETERGIRKVVGASQVKSIRA